MNLPANDVSKADDQSSMQLVVDKAATLDALPDTAAQLEAEIAKVIVGQHGVVRQSIIALACGGHCLLRGVPGLAKRCS